MRVEPVGGKKGAPRARRDSLLRERTPEMKGDEKCRR